MELKFIILLFLIYSIFGWIMEITYAFLKIKKIINRGFLIGPYCPIYGFGALLILILLNKYINDLLVLFILSCLLGAILEYVTSYFLEKIFKVRWWDYSNRKFNINGRIGLIMALCFGILGVILVCYFNPFIESLLNYLPDIILIIISVIFGILILTDFIISFKIISNIKKIDIEGAKDATEEISKKVKEILKSKSRFNNRLMKAFPNLKIQFNKTKEKIKKISKF